MSRPRISEAKRRMWKMFPLSAPGVVFTPAQWRAIYALYDQSDTYQAQMIILRKLRSHFDRPQTVARWRNRRKVLCAAR